MEVGGAEGVTSGGVTQGTKELAEQFGGEESATVVDVSAGLESGQVCDAIGLIQMSQAGAMPR